MKAIKDGFEFIAVTLLASFLLIFVSVFYFGLTLWIIKTASGYFFGNGLEANYAVLAASLMTVGSVLAGALEKKKTSAKM